MSGDGAGPLDEELHRWVDEKARELEVSRGAVLARALESYRAAEDGGTVVDPEDLEDLDDLEVQGDPTEGDTPAPAPPDDRETVGTVAGDLLGTGGAPGAADGAIADRLSALEERVTAIEGGDRVDPERVADLSERVDELAAGLADRDAVEPADEGTTAALDDRLERLDDRVGEMSADFGEKLRDVRERVVQVKRETDGKAHVDHDHGELRARAERAATAVEKLAQRIDELDARIDAGFDNYEEVLEHLTDATDDLDDRATTLVRATVDLRDRVARLEAERDARGILDEVRATANRNGDATATCEACGGTVRVGLLSRPECPHCAATFEAVDPATGLFGSATLRTGPLPALDGETAEPDAPADLDAGEEGGS